MAGWLARWMAGWVGGWVAGWLACLSAGWLACWMAGWLVGFLAGLLAVFIQSSDVRKMTFAKALDKCVETNKRLFFLPTLLHIRHHFYTVPICEEFPDAKMAQKQAPT